MNMEETHKKLHVKVIKLAKDIKVELSEVYCILIHSSQIMDSKYKFVSSDYSAPT